MFTLAGLLSLPLKEPSSLCYENSFVDVKKKKKRETEKKNKTTKQSPCSRSFIIHRVGAWKGICFDLVTTTKTKRLSLIAQMTQVGLGVKSNKSLTSSELYVNTGHQAPACSSARPGAQKSPGKQKPANSLCLHAQTGPGARTNLFHKLQQCL